MSKTYRGWAEIDDWSSGREFRRAHKRKSESAWKRELNEEQGMSEIRVFVIINEWTDVDGYVSSEVVGGRWFPSEDEAWLALSLVAESFDIDPDGEATSFTVEGHDTGLQSEEYRIEELTR